MDEYKEVPLTAKEVKAKMVKVLEEQLADIEEKKEYWILAGFTQEQLADVIAFVESFEETKIEEIA